MFKTIMTALPLAALLAVSAVPVVQAGHYPDRQEVHMGEFDCRNIGTRAEWDACWTDGGE